MSEHHILVVELQKAPDGELYFNLSDELISRLKWKEGDNLQFVKEGDDYFIKKLINST